MFKFLPLRSFHARSRGNDHETTGLIQDAGASKAAFPRWSVGTITIFQVEDSIIEKRDSLIESLERRLTQKTESDRLFTIEWEVI